MIDFEHLTNPEKYHTVPPRVEGEKDEQYKARLKAYVQGIKSQHAKIDELQKKLDCCREENKAHLEKIDEALTYLRHTDFRECKESILFNILKGNKDEN